LSERRIKSRQINLKEDRDFEFETAPVPRQARKECPNSPVRNVKCFRELFRVESHQREMLLSRPWKRRDPRKWLKDNRRRRWRISGNEEIYLRPVKGIRLKIACCIAPGTMTSQLHEKEWRSRASQHSEHISETVSTSRS
jgi:hypothetical protein